MDIHIRHEVEQKIRHTGYLAAAPFAEMWLTFLEICRETGKGIVGVPGAVKEMFHAR